MDKQLREKVYNKYKGCCAYCGQKIIYRSMQVDHIVPQSNYDSDMMHEKMRDLRVPGFLKHLTLLDVNHIDNLNPSCRKCNNFKSSFTLELFREELQKQVSRAKKSSSNYRRALQYGQIVEKEHPIVFHFEKMLKDPTDYEVIMTKGAILEDEVFEFLVWYQKAPLDGKNQAEIIDIYLNEVRNEH